MRALMAPSGVGRSHLTRLMLIARELRRRGAEVAFAVNQVDPLFAWEGFDTFDVPEVEITDFDRNVFGAYTPELVEACVDAELRAIEVSPRTSWSVIFGPRWRSRLRSPRSVTSPSSTPTLRGSSTRSRYSATARARWV
jgi:hypothetical protein